jgi:hypothetical protein
MCLRQNWGYKIPFGVGGYYPLFWAPLDFGLSILYLGKAGYSDYIREADSMMIYLTYHRGLSIHNLKKKAGYTDYIREAVSTATYSQWT